MLARIALIAAVLCSLTLGASAQDDLYVPSEEPRHDAPAPAPPKPRIHPLAGSWYTVTKGSMLCNFGTGFIDIAADGRSGHADVGGFPGAVSLRYTAPDVYLTYGYADSFGGDAIAVYDGTLSADKNTITGILGGTWEDNCTFTMQRR